VNKFIKYVTTYLHNIRLDILILAAIIVEVHFEDFLIYCGMHLKEKILLQYYNLARRNIEIINNIIYIS